METGETLYVTTREEWRRWLEKHHKRKKEIWLIFYKKDSGKLSISYSDSVEEAICFGWIDAQVKSIDNLKYAGRYSPRKENSDWSESNIQRAFKMLQEGRMVQAGMAVLPPEVIRVFKGDRKTVSGKRA